MAVPGELAPLAGAAPGTLREPGPELRPNYPWLVFSVTSLGVLLTALNSSTLEVALPVVVRHYHASAPAASWILLSYLLASTVLIVPFGRLADILGRRRLYLAGLALFTVASAVAGWAPNVEILIAARVAQAVGAASVMANTTALLTDAFSGPRLSLALGMNVTVAGVGLVVGPALGGLLADSLGWRSVFWFNLPVGVVSLMWASRTLRDLVQPTLHSGQREPFDLGGAVLALVTVGSFVYAVSMGGTHGSGSALAVGGFAVFVVAFPALLISQRRSPFPLIDLTLFADRERAIAFVLTLILALARFALVLLIALYLQAAHGWTAQRTGLLIMPTAAGMMVASPFAARLARHMSARVVSTLGLGVTAAGLFYLSVVLDPHTGSTELASALAAIGVGSGLFMTPNTSSIMASVVPERRGVANALRSMLQSIGTVTGTALCLAIVTGPLAPGEQAAAYAGTLSKLSAHTLPAFTDAYHRALLLLGVVTAAGAVASLLRNPPPTK